MQLPSISTLCLQTHDCKPGPQNVDMGIDIAMSVVDFLLRANVSLLFLKALRRWRPNAQSIPLPQEIKKVVKKAGEDLVPVQGEDPAARSLAPHGPARIIRSRNRHLGAAPRRVEKDRPDAQGEGKFAAPRGLGPRGAANLPPP